MVETDAAETSGRLFLLARRTHQQNGLLTIEHSSCPACKLATQANVDAARQMSCRKLGRVPHVQDLSAGVHSGQELSERKWFQHLIQCLVQSCILLVVENCVII